MAGEGANNPQAVSDAPNAGGQGETALLNDPHHTRADLKLIHRAEREWGLVPGSRRRKIVERACEIAEGEKDLNTALSAMRVVAAFESNDLHALEMFDKIDRLDHNKNTENVGVNMGYIQGVDEADV